jgi:hypothetical protein
LQKDAATSPARARAISVPRSHYGDVSAAPTRGGDSSHGCVTADPEGDTATGPAPAGSIANVNARGGNRGSRGAAVGRDPSASLKHHGSKEDGPTPRRAIRSQAIHLTRRPTSSAERQMIEQRVGERPPAHTPYVSRSVVAKATHAPSPAVPTSPTSCIFTDPSTATIRHIASTCLGRSIAGHRDTFTFLRSGGRGLVKASTTSCVAWIV